MRSRKAHSAAVVVAALALTIGAIPITATTSAAATDTPSPVESPVPSPVSSPAPHVSPESGPSTPSAPVPPSASATPIPAPPGGASDWSSQDGKAPSQAWFDAYQKAVTTPANGQNVLLPWESPAGQVQVGQGTAVSGGWSIIDANGNAGAGISCGSVCNSGWFPTGFGSDGRPTTWVRVVQQTSAVDGNAWTGPGRYAPETGWTVPGPSGSHQWDWQSNERGPCIADCVQDPAPGQDVEPSVDTRSDEPDGLPSPRLPGHTQSAVSTAVGSAVGGSTTIEALAVAVASTTTHRLSAGGFRIVAQDQALRVGQRVTVLLHRQGRPVSTRTVTVRKPGSVSASLPSGSRGTLIMLAAGRIVGVAELGAAAGGIIR